MRQGSNQINPNVGILGGELRYLALLIFSTLAYLIVGLWLRQIRWINPDEGAHIADAVLLLDGKIPVVDYPSRQPLYVLFLAIDLLFMGHNLTGARVAPLVATILTGIAVYFLIRLRFDASYAFVGSLAYLLLPLNIALATVVKMEPFVLVLGTAAAVCCIAALSSNRAAAWLFASGLLIAASFYVRESTAYAVLFASLGTFAFFKPAKYSRGLGIMWISAGLACGFLLALGFFGPRMGLAAFFQSGLNPTNIVLRATQGLSSASLQQQPVEQTIDTVRFLVNSHMFLLFGSLLGVGFCFFSSGRSRDRADVSVFCGLWLAGLIVIYAIRGIQAAIYPSYGREFTVPAIVLTVATVRWLWEGLERHVGTTRFASLLLVAVVALQLLLVTGQLLVLEEPGLIFVISLLLMIPFVYLCTRPTADISGSSFHPYRVWVLATAVLFAGFVIRAMMSFAKPIVGSDGYFFLSLAALAGISWLVLLQTPLPLGAVGRASGLIVLVASMLYSLSTGRNILDRRYDNVWSPRQLSEVTRYLDQHVPPGGTVLSGANIWPIEARRKLFGEVSHPLGLRVRPSREIGDILRESPPNAIVLDGYTERTYGSRFDLGDMIKRRYSGGNDVTIEGESRYPVVIHLLNDRRLTTPP